MSEPRLVGLIDAAALIGAVRRARGHVTEGLVICNAGGLSTWELRQVLGFCLTQAWLALDPGVDAELEAVGKALADEGFRLVAPDVEDGA